MSSIFKNFSKIVLSCAFRETFLFSFDQLASIDFFGPAPCVDAKDEKDELVSVKSKIFVGFVHATRLIIATSTDRCHRSLSLSLYLLVSVSSVLCSVHTSCLIRRANVSLDLTA